MNVCVYGSASLDLADIYYEKTEHLGETLGKRGHNLVFGGGANGMMGAAARGFKKAGAKITGVAPSFFKVDGILYEKTDKMIYTDTMRQRKQKMDDLSDAFVVTPGGIGTFEEFFEIYTLLQLGQTSKPLAVYNVNDYFKYIKLALEDAAKQKFMPDNSLHLVKFFDKEDDVVDYIENHKAENFDVLKYRSIELEKNQNLKR